MGKIPTFLTNLLTRASVRPGIVTIAAIAGILIMPGLGQAQVTSPSSAASQLGNPGEPDPNAIESVFSGRNANGGTPNIINLINQLQLLNGTSAAEFQENQERRFDSAVEEFQQKQQDALGTSPQQTPAQPPVAVPQ
jgi:hypothetical protein